MVIILYSLIDGVVPAFSGSPEVPEDQIMVAVVEGVDVVTAYLNDEFLDNRPSKVVDDGAVEVRCARSARKVNSEGNAGRTGYDDVIVTELGKWYDENVSLVDDGRVVGCHHRFAFELGRACGALVPVGVQLSSKFLLHLGARQVRFRFIIKIAIIIL